MVSASTFRSEAHAGALLVRQGPAAAAAPTPRGSP
jgi:hypothetical protein